MIRAAAILQLLLGNIGRPGGGIMALRGHAAIQGSTDIPTLYNLLPGYLQMPTASATQSTCNSYIESLTGADELLGQLPEVHRQPAQGLVRRRGDHRERLGLPLAAQDRRRGRPLALSHVLPHAEDRKIAGLFVMATEPRRRRPERAVLERDALRKLDWLVVRDLFETETATFWQAPEIARGELPATIDTEVFFLPAALSAEKDGSFTNTQRLLQWHDKARRPARRRALRDLVYGYHLRQ